MFNYILKRLGLLLLTLVVILTIVFFLIDLIPGYPTAVANKIAAADKPEIANDIIKSYEASAKGNTFIAFFQYLGNAFRGDFGQYYGDPTTTIPTLFFKPLKYTLLIVGPAFLIGTSFGIIFGFVSGYKRGKWQDITVNIAATFFVSVPSFVLAMFLILFGKNVGLPLSFSTAIATKEVILAAILPILIISITSFSTLTYYIRNEVVEVLSSDYILIARAKGLSEKDIFFKHVIRNVSIPFISIVLPSFLTIIFGSLIIELFFDVPGSSAVFSLAVTQNEPFVILFSTMFFTAFGLAIQLLVDILYVVFDPRISLGQKSSLSMRKKLSARRQRKDEAKEIASQKGVR